MAAASGVASSPPPPPPQKKKRERILLTFTLSGVLGVDSLNFIMTVYLIATCHNQLISFVLKEQQSKGKRFKGKRPFTVPYFLRACDCQVRTETEQPPSLLNMPSET